MIERLRAFLAGGMRLSEIEANPGERGGESDPEALRVAACALLLEVAHADDYFSRAERTHLRALARRQFGLRSAAADELIAAAEDERRSRGSDVQSFADLIKHQYSDGQKVVLAEAMWGLVLADGDREGRADFIMRKISGLIGLKTGYLADARSRHDELRGKDSR